MGYMPVITNFAAPILDHVTKKNQKFHFQAVKFSSFAEMAESLRNGSIQVAFIIAPLSIVLHHQDPSIKVVYIGNRHESTLVVRKGLNIHHIRDLKGRTVAVPIRYSGHNIALLEAFSAYGLNDQVRIVEMNPPDMASAFLSGGIDGYFVGEPFAAKVLKSGNADLLAYVEEIWPYFICNLVIMREEFIQNESKLATLLVHGAARSGIWIRKNPDKASEIASLYWNQSKSLIEYALSTPPNRIVFDHFIPIQSEIEHLASLMKKYHLIENDAIDGIIDDRMAKSADLNDVVKLSDIIPQERDK